MMTNSSIRDPLWALGALNEFNEIVQNICRYWTGLDYFSSCHQNGAENEMRIFFPDKMKTLNTFHQLSG